MPKALTWEQRIDAAEKRGRFTLQDKRDAGQWNKCAVGEKLSFKTSRVNPLKAQRTMELHELVDTEFFGAGCDFYNYGVNMDDFETARYHWGIIQSYILTPAQKKLVADAKRKKK